MHIFCLLHVSPTVIATEAFRHYICRRRSYFRGISLTCSSERQSSRQATLWRRFIPFPHANTTRVVLATARKHCPFVYNTRGTNAGVPFIHIFLHPSPSSLEDVRARIRMMWWFRKVKIKIISLSKITDERTHHYLEQRGSNRGNPISTHSLYNVRK